MADNDYTPTIKQADNNPRGPFILETGDGREFEVGDRVRMYSSYAALDSMYGPFAVMEDENRIPIEIAVEGSAALATYLMMVYQVHYDMSYKMAINNTAEKIDVKKCTVRKYINRIGKRM